MVKQATDGVIPPIETITVFYGHWRDYKTFPDSIMHWESDVVEKAGAAMGRRIRHEVVFAAVRMFGEIWGKRGTILGPG
jgi:hypothetical protein